MSSLEKKLFKDITVKGNAKESYDIGSKYYRGISTVNPNNSNPVLYDIALIKQDIINHFHNYLRQNYPEDFNDYIESSEYLALIDLIAFLGQNLAFRMDLNARENYLELAERRESVLRLARLLSYNPKRNIAANGIMKMASVTTSESFVDSNNINLENQTIIWNDPANPNWYEQFVKVLNRAMPTNGVVGKPVKKEIIDGIPTEQYRLNSNNTGVPLFSFSTTVDQAQALAPQIDKAPIRYKDRKRL